ncbi:MAG: CBS domain-containing protein [Oscillospiraceae bacterium]|jgi:CBS domain-containing protein|nr:CBS domain-containing protein [Oscillospiraceae bacterium]
MLVSDIMKQSVVSITPNAPVSSAARLLKQYNVGSLPVCSPDGTLRGVVTDRDIVTRCIAAEENPQEMPVKEIMTRAVQSIAPHEDLRLAAQRMADKRIRRLPVTDPGGKLRGILSLGDIAKARNMSMEAAAALSEISQNIKQT